MLVPAPLTTISDTPTALKSMYSVAVWVPQMLCFAHWRSVEGVGALVWYSSLAQAVMVLHSRSEVAVSALDMNSV
jgi:hypothetical protein